jgi:type II secretory pathway pseudopilin PulG
MQYRPENRDDKGDGEAGYVLLAVIFLTVVLLISLAVAAPKIAMSIQRDKDLETIHRGEQYKRAIQLYYRQFNAYPTSIDQLVDTNNVRFLRKRYLDPETGKDDWKLIRYGQAHVRPMGFFGQPLSAVAGLMASATAGGGMAGGMYALGPATTTDANGLPVADNGTGSATDSSGTPGATGSTDAFGNNTGASSGSSFGSNSSFGSSNSGFGSNSPNGGAFGAGGQNGAGANGLGGNQSPGGLSNSGPGGSSTSAFGSNSTSATTFGGGGGPIVGFGLSLNKPSLVVYKKQSTYNKWEFNYDPMEEQMEAASGLLGGGGSIDGSGTGNTLGNGSNPNGQNGAFGGGNTNGFGGNSPGVGSPGPGNPGSGTPGPGSQNPPQTPQQ